MIIGADARDIMSSNVALVRRHKVNAINFWILVVSLATCTWFSLLPVTTALPLDEFYPFDLQNDNYTAVKDDGGSPRLQLDVDFPFFNNTSQARGGVYVNNNGIISFSKELNTYKPMNFDQQDFNNNIPLIAPFWADVDIKNVQGLNETIRYRITNASDVIDKASRDVRTFFIGQQNFTAKQVLIVTWYKVGFYGASGEGKNKRNTFQAVLVTDGVTSYAVFNYNETVWTTGSNSAGHTETGLGGDPAVVGFHSGTADQYYLVENSGTDAIVNISDSSNINVAGKYIYKISGATIDDLQCAASEHLAIHPSTVSMLGSEAIEISGPCLSTSEPAKARIRELQLEFPCGVTTTNDLRSGRVTTKAVCVVPTLYRTGEFTLDFDPAGTGWRFNTTITSVHILSMAPKVIRKNPESWKVGDNAPFWTVEWERTSVPAGPKFLSLMTYSDNNGEDPKLEVVHGTLSDLDVTSGETRKFRVRSLNPSYDTLIVQLCWDVLPNINRTCIWSDVFPVRWSGSQQQALSEQWCAGWLRRETARPPINIHAPFCPCVKSIAENDVGHFHRDPNCDRTSVSDAPHCVYNPNAHTCFRRNIKRSDDSGETCCYDAAGDLMDIREAPGAGTHQRHHYKAQGPASVPYFSYFKEDLLPRLHCCDWSSKNCSQFIRHRNATTCQLYKPPSPALAAGDPHIVTLDGRNYSFNGVGDYFLVFDNATYTVIQVRAIQARDDNNTLQNATVFSAVAIAVLGWSDIVEIRQTNRTVEKYEVLVNKQTVQIAPSSTSQFKNISVVHKESGNFLVVLEPVSVSVTVQVTPDLINIIVLIGEESMKGSLRGLLGNYNGDQSDDLIPRYSDKPLATTSMRDIHYDFGLTWEVKPNESILAQPDGAAMETISQRFEPVFLDEPLAGGDQDKIQEICKGNKQCEFDYQVTGKESIARSTVEIANKFEEQKSQLNEKVVRCPFLSIPENGNKTQNGSSLHSIATFSCNHGYEPAPESTLTRVCREDNTWSGGDFNCIIKVVVDEPISLLLVGGVSGAGAVVLVIVVLVVYIHCKRRHQTKPEEPLPLQIISTGTVGSIFENHRYVEALKSLSKDGERYTIPRPKFADPQIFEDFF